MKNLNKYIIKDPITKKYSFAHRDCKCRPDPEDYLFEVQRTSRFKKDTEERRKCKINHRMKNLFKDNEQKICSEQ